MVHLGYSENVRRIVLHFQGRGHLHTRIPVSGTEHIIQVKVVVVVVIVVVVVVVIVVDDDVDDVDVDWMKPGPGVQIVKKGAKKRATARRTASEKCREDWREGAPRLPPFFPSFFRSLSFAPFLDLFSRLSPLMPGTGYYC